MKSQTVIYADALLWVNFTMDFLALYITARLTHSAVRPLRMAAAAAAGSLFALIAAVAEPQMRAPFIKFIGLAAFALCAAVMCAAAFGGIKPAAVFIAVNVSLGGIMTAFYTALGRVTGERLSAEPDASPVLFAVIATISGAVSLLYGHFRQKKARQTIVRIEADGRSWELSVLVDSGNFLREPISGRAVIIAAAGKLDVDERTMSGRLRMIPAGGVTGERLLAGFLPDRVTCEGRALDAVVALDPRAADYNGCGGILPEILLI